MAGVSGCSHGRLRKIFWVCRRARTARRAGRRSRRGRGPGSPPAAARSGRPAGACALQGGVDVDEDVAAEDEVELRERRVAREVLAREHAAVADQLAHPVAAVDPGEEPPQPRRRHRVGDRRRVEARRETSIAVSLDVGAEDLEVQLGRRLAGGVEQRHRQRVHLLAGRAAGDPDPQRRPCAAAREQGGQHLARERLERLGLAEEARHVDQEVLVEGARLLGAAAQQGQVGVQVVHAVEGHPAQQAALDRRAACSG